MNTIKVKHFMESQNKAYIHSYKPVTFYKVKDEYHIDDDREDEYVCTSVRWHYDRLKLFLTPTKEWAKRTKRLQKEDKNIYAFAPIVNVQNIKDKIDEQIWHELYQREIKKGEPLTKEENATIVKSFFNKKIVCTIESEWNGYELPICNEKNAYRSNDERMRFFFLINECKYCKYCRKTKHYSSECVNVVSEHYGKDNIDEKNCNDFREKTLINGVI